MHRQVGELKLDENGIAKRGVLVRHLMMPGHLAETQAVLQLLADELSRDTYVNLMAQYHPGNKVNAVQYSEINRRITSEEYRAAVEFASQVGLWRLDERHFGPRLW